MARISECFFLGKIFVLFHFALLQPKIYFSRSFEPCWNIGVGNGCTRVYSDAWSFVQITEFAVEVLEEAMGSVAHRRGERE